MSHSEKIVLPPRQYHQTHFSIPGRNRMNSNAQYLIMGNAKMNLFSDDYVQELSAALRASGNRNARVALFPTTIQLGLLRSELQDSAIALGGQDCHFEKSGPYTGDISPSMLKGAGCEYVILGHSERRQHHQESSDMVGKKAAAAIVEGLTPVICVGETLQEREAGNQYVVVAEQLRKSVPSVATAENIVIAYEPVWAIGTGKVASLEDISQMHNSIRNHLVRERAWSSHNLKILYGGSVKPENAKDILAQEGVNGALVGGACLKAREFAAIAAAVPAREPSASRAS